MTWSHHIFYFIFGFTLHILSRQNSRCDQPECTNSTFPLDPNLNAVTPLESVHPHSPSQICPLPPNLHRHRHAKGWLEGGLTIPRVPPEAMLVHTVSPALSPGSQTLPGLHGVTALQPDLDHWCNLQMRDSIPFTFSLPHSTASL